MFVYSKKIAQFVSEIKGVIKDVLSREVRLKVTEHRFYDRRQTASYPITVVIYNDQKMLGYFDPNFYELGFHECLMHTSRQQLHNVIRHELAHYMTFINCGSTQAHGAEFKEFCQRMGWGEEIYKATSSSDGGISVSEIEESGVFRKVQKLMALTTSSDKNEAEQAMVKSQQLLLKHNIESKYIGNEDEEKIFLKRIMKQPKNTAKMQSIAKILETFFVSVVYSRGGEFTCLEILGNAANVEIAEYVATILQAEFEHLWEQAQIYAHLKGAIAKNSFFLGLAKGYCNKIHALKKEYNSEVANALMVLEKKLIDAKAMAYTHLSSSKSSGNYCGMASALGEKMGNQLNINPALNRSSVPSGTYLTKK